MYVCVVLCSHPKGKSWRRMNLAHSKPLWRKYFSRLNGKGKCIQCVYIVHMGVPVRERETYGHIDSKDKKLCLALILMLTLNYRIVTKLRHVPVFSYPECSRAMDKCGLGWWVTSISFPQTVSFPHLHCLPCAYLKLADHVFLSHLTHIGFRDVQNSTFLWVHYLIIQCFLTR